MTGKKRAKRTVSKRALINRPDGLDMREGHCVICARFGLLQPKPSQLDGYDYWACASCWDARAESWVSVANYCRSGNWKLLDRRIKLSIRFWQNERYERWKAAMKQQLAQQAVPYVEPPAPPPYPPAGKEDGLDDDGSKRLQGMLDEWRKKIPPASDDPVRPSILETLREMLLGWLRPIWRDAYAP